MTSEANVGMGMNFANKISVTCPCCPKAVDRGENGVRHACPDGGLRAHAEIKTRTVSERRRSPQSVRRVSDLHRVRGHRLKRLDAAGSKSVKVKRTKELGFL
jgi:predicted RNA-binding Zn-ribbon protein involved in translation (DUF1610 family)